MADHMFVQPPLVRTARPRHVETMFQDRSRAPSFTSSHRSADSVGSSVASPTDVQYDAGPKYQELRTLSPAFEEDIDDCSSLRSFATSFSFKKPKWRLLEKLHRRSQPAIDRAASAQGHHVPRKLSMNPLQVHSRQNSSMLHLASKPASPTRLESLTELSSRKCYYSIARNCPGWVIGGGHGDACDACLKAGFFGSP